MEKNKFWLSQITSQILKRSSPKKHIVASGVSPSGPIHLGGFREVLTAYGVFQAFKDRGVEAQLIHIADDYDPLRRVYPFLPNSYKKYVGRPLSEIPDPWQCHRSYAQHFLKHFLEGLKKIYIEPKVYYASKLYKEGKFTPLISEALKNKRKLAEIISRITGRQLDDDWMPFNPICRRCRRLTHTKIIDFNLDSNKVFYLCNCGYKGEADFSKGEGKLPWRIDWPARWKLLKITVEPLGKDHAASGGSWDTGQEISRKVFGYSPPWPIFYEWIHLKGQGAMSSSKGIALDSQEFLSVTYPEILRYYLFRSLPQKHLDFDPGAGLLQILEEFTHLEENYHKNKGNKYSSLYEISNPNFKERVLSGVPFDHLAFAFQAALGDYKEIERILRRTGYLDKIQDKRRLKKEIYFVKNWLDKFAPEKYKFSIAPKLPSQAKVLSSKQKKLLRSLASFLSQKKMTPEEIHNKIYELGQDLGLAPAESFIPIYRVLLGQDSGPKAGWFISMLDREFIINRFWRASKR